MSEAIDDESRKIAQEWCSSKGSGWSIGKGLGEGGTAPVYEVLTPDGVRALKLYSAEFSDGKKGLIERKRIEQQLALRDHNCPSLVQIFDGGEFHGRLFLLMARAPGTELEKRLHEIPRHQIRHIVDQVARAVAFLRTLEICHRDIKAANVYVSDDATQVTLLDVSVTRNIYDPVGVGTDHDGQLPVVATARYSPPEYLFRLLEPGPELWHALDVYQLGALLHDLIMRRPLFESEFKAASENRYRFAWLVATTAPRLEATDVDQDLMFLARRALDKDWRRRSSLKIESFFEGAVAERSNALGLLGLGTAAVKPQDTGEAAKRLARIRDVSNTISQSMTEYLQQKGVTARHKVDPGSNDLARSVRFEWPTQDFGPQTTNVEYIIEIILQPSIDDLQFISVARLEIRHGESIRSVNLTLPAVSDGSEAESILAALAESALAELAIAVSRST